MTPNNFRVKSGLTVGTTISGGNTTITGFANVNGNITSRNLLLQGDNTNAYIRPSNSPSNLYLGANGTNYLTVFSNGNFNVGSSLTVAGISTFNSTVTLGSVGLSSNGSLGTAGHVLHSNGTATYWAADDGITSVAAANGLNGGTITSTGTISVLGGSTLTVNTTGVHVNSTLSLTDLTLSGNLTVSGTRTYVNTTTLDVGDNIITLNADLGASAPSQNAGIEIMRGTSANVQFIWDETNDRWSTNSQPLAISSLVAAGAASGITTLAAGNTTITGFANVVSTGGAQAAAALRSGTYGVFVVPQASAGAYNNLTGNNDNLLYFSNGTMNGGSLLIGTWTDRAAGYGVRLTGSTYDIALVSNTISLTGITEFGAGYNEIEVANAAVTGTFTMNCAAANFFDLTLIGNTTISPSNVPPSTRVWSGSIAAKQDATGGRTITWPAGTKYAGGVAPPATTTANALDIWSLMTYDGGTSWIVSLSVKGVA